MFELWREPVFSFYFLRYLYQFRGGKTMADDFLLELAEQDLRTSEKALAIIGEELDSLSAELRQQGRPQTRRTK